MTIDFINKNFSQDSFGEVIVQSFDNGTFISIDSTILMNLTAGTSANPTYAELSGLTIASQGWQSIFDSWKERGIIA